MNAAPTSTSPANRVSAGTIRPSLPDNKTVDFDAVYDGDHKHTIVEYPKASNKWYILCCDEHSVHFGANPLQGSSKHLNGKKHGYQRKDFDLAVQMLGILVLNCDAEKAKQNNLMFGRAWDAGYRPLGAHGPKASRTLEKTQDGTSHDRQSSVPTTTPARQEKPKCFEGVTEPTVGEIYRVWYKPKHAYYSALMLPTGSFDPVGMAGGISETGLASCVPACYHSARKTKVILGWAEGYEDGGPRVHRRRFPMMFFDDNLIIPLEGDLGIPEGKLFSWVFAKDLRPFNLDDQSVHGSRAARAFCQRAKKMARAESYESHGLSPKRTDESVPS